jgi:ribonuclease VapC
VIIDSSAVVAILRQEPEALRCATAIERASARRMSAATYLEAAIVIDSEDNPVNSRRFDQLMREAAIEIVPVTAAHVRVAREAYRDFGKGRGHRAQLNFGDCFAYSLAYTTGEPLLFTGLDFADTGIESA